MIEPFDHAIREVDSQKMWSKLLSSSRFTTPQPRITGCNAVYTTAAIHTIFPTTVDNEEDNMEFIFLKNGNCLINDLLLVIIKLRIPGALYEIFFLGDPQCLRTLYQFWKSNW